MAVGEPDEAVSTSLLDKDTSKTNEESKKGQSDDSGKRIKYMQRKTLTILLGILNVFLLIILIVIIAYFVKDQSQRVIIKPAKTFCLPCEEISIHPDDDPANFKEYFVQRKENGKMLCCADDGKNLEKMMELVSLFCLKNSLFTKCRYIFSLYDSRGQSLSHVSFCHHLASVVC